jgi:sialic acid synthase SpsE
MHCVSEYPTGPLLERYGLKALSLQDARLNMMRILKERFPQHKVGYSDHTSGILAPIVAVSMGADVIEKHITLDRKTPIRNYYQKKKYLGTDHILSLEPDELKEMVTAIRLVEQMLGEKKWRRSKGELLLKAFLRKRFRHE